MCLKNITYLFTKYITILFVVLGCINIMDFYVMYMYYQKTQNV